MIRKLAALPNYEIRVLFTNCDTSRLIVAFSANVNQPGLHIISSVHLVLKCAIDDVPLHRTSHLLLQISAHLTKANPSKGGDAKQPIHAKIVDSGAAGILRVFHTFLAPRTMDRAKCAQAIQHNSGF